MSDEEAPDGGLSSSIASSEGKLVGVGIVFDESVKDRLRVESLVPGSGADQCGEIFGGDELLTLDGVDVNGRQVADLAPIFMGPSGTTAILTLMRRLEPSNASPPAGDVVGDEVEAEAEAEAPVSIVVVEVPRVDFSTEPSQYVSWVDQGEEDTKTPEGGKAGTLDGLRSGAGRFFNSFGKSVGANITPMSSQLIKQMRQMTDDFSDKVQKNEVIQNIQSKATMVRHAATSAALPVLKNIQREDSSLPDPAPKEWCMHLYTCPDKYVIFPPSTPAPDPAGKAPEAVVIDRVSMVVTAMPVAQAETLVVARTKIEILGVVGIATLEVSSYLVVCTARGFVGALPQGRVYKVMACESRVLGAKIKNPNPIQMSHRAIEQRLLDELLDTFEMFFSHEWDVTQSQQRLETMAALPPTGDQKGAYDRREQRFVWNHKLLEKMEGCHHCRVLLPVVAGFVQFKTVTLPKGKALLAMIGRRDWHRPGYRYMSRGIDAEGNVSNAVETEQIIIALREDPPAPPPTEGAGNGGALGESANGGGVVPGRRGGEVAVFGRDAETSAVVMMRGSVPLLWCEADAVMTLKPKPDIAPKELQGAPMDVHLKDMRGSYGNIILLSLIEQREQSHERQLGLLFDAQMTKVTGEAVPPPGTEFDEAAERKKRGPVTYIPFDFHSVCGKLAFRNLPKLVKVCVEALREDCSFFIAGKQKQVGTFRVNCIDCLDRTNVAQSVLAFRAALWQLEALALIQKDERKACEDKVTKEERQPYPWAEHLDQTLKHMWADHGDAISLQYSGTFALKGDLTRTGKRTVGGLVQDGISSVKRCVQNNFADTHRQQVVEAFHGHPPVINAWAGSPKPPKDPKEEHFGQGAQTTAQTPKDAPTEHATNHAAKEDNGTKEDATP